MGQIRTLLIVLATAVFGAFFVVGLLLYVYNPSGQYEGKNVLLDPALVGELSFDSMSPKTGGSTRYVFDKIELSAFDPQRNLWESHEIPLERYAAFFEAVKSEKSLEKPSDELTQLFAASKPATLTIWVKTVSQEAWQRASKAILLVEFAPSSKLYRVSLRDEQSGEAWAYFMGTGAYSDDLPATIAPASESESAS